MEDSSVKAIITTIAGVQSRVDDVHLRLGEMVTHSEHEAEMRQVTARLDRVQQSVADERAERVAQAQQDRAERQDEIREERASRLEAEAANRMKSLKVLSITLAALTLVFTIITYALGKVAP